MQETVLYFLMSNLRGCLHVKTRTGASLIPVWHNLWFHTVFTWRVTSCRPMWLWRHIELDIKDCACATCFRHPGECFHAGANSRTAFTWHWNEFLYQNENFTLVQLLGEVAPVCLARVWDFVLISCKRIQSHKKEPERTCNGMKVAPVSCKHPLKLQGRFVEK